jgi:hypothetical protein
MQNTDDDFPLSSELVEYKDAYTKFEKDKLGNKGNNIMNYGLVCRGDDFVVYEKIENNSRMLVVQKDGVENVISNEDVEYINTDNRVIYYVKKSDNSIYKNDFDGNEQQFVGDIASGEMLLYDGTLYFINNNDNCNVYSLNISGDKQPEKIIEDKVVKFVVSGNYIIYLNDKNVIGKYDLDSKLISQIQNKIEDFCYNGSIIALNNKKLIQFKSSGKNAKILLEDDVILLNSDAEYVYYSKGGDLFQYEISSETETKLIEGYDVYKAVYKVDSKLFCYAFNKNADNSYEESLVIRDL